MCACVVSFCSFAAYATQTTLGVPCGCFCQCGSLCQDGNGEEIHNIVSCFSDYTMMEAKGDIIRSKRRHNRVKRQRREHVCDCEEKEDRKKAMHLRGKTEVVKIRQCGMKVMCPTSSVCLTVNLTLFYSTIMSQLTLMVQTITHICSTNNTRNT